MNFMDGEPGADCGCMTAMAVFLGRVRAALLCGVPPSGGSNQSELPLKSPEVTEEEPAAPEDSHTRLKAVLQTGLARAVAPLRRPATAEQRSFSGGHGPGHRGHDPGVCSCYLL